MQCLTWVESGWNGLENSNYNALFLSLDNGENGVTVRKQGLGWVLFDVWKLLEWF